MNDFLELETEMTKNEFNIDFYHNKEANEILPLANLYGPDDNLRFQNNTIKQPLDNKENNDYILQIYIGSISILGIIVLYKFYQKS
jgi:hypothetical protein